MVDFFNLVETKGLPLDLALTAINQQGLVPDWIGFWEHALDKGWIPKGTRLRIEAAILEVYGQEYLEQWQRRMLLYFQRE